MERMMKVQDVLLKAMAKKITWWTAAEILGSRTGRCAAGENGWRGRAMPGWRTGGRGNRAPNGHWYDLIVILDDAILRRVGRNHLYPQILHRPAHLRQPVLVHLLSLTKSGSPIAVQRAEQPLGLDHRLRQAPS